MGADARADKLSALRASEFPVVIGLGAIGSWVARWMSANGIEYAGYDDDVVSMKNLTAGAFAQDDVGRYKYTALGVINGRRDRWDLNSSVSRTTSMLVCADHGQTRRDAVKQATHIANRWPFYCAKANGAMWQVWQVARDESPDDFIAFDEAAEANPVLTPCGEATVGRVASLGAAAEILSAWSGLQITPEEVEASYGVKFDAALGHVLTQGWNDLSAAAMEEATEQARQRYEEEIEKARVRSDELAVQALLELRTRRHLLKRKRRSTIHQRAMVMLDTGSSTKDAARSSVGESRPLSRLSGREKTIAARQLESTLSVPDSVTFLEVSA